MLKRNSKAFGALTGSGVGAAISTILVCAVESFSAVDFPDPVETAITLLITATVAAVTTWYFPANEV